jgi:GDP-L-fucose synthase
MKKNSKILVAGAAGMVGSSIVRKLLEFGFTNIVGSYHRHRPDISAITLTKDMDYSTAAFRLVQLDLTNQYEVERFFTAEKPDYVFMAAAKVGGIHANNTYPAQFIYENLAIQNNMIHQAYLTKVKRLLFLGSSCIYPKLAPQPMNEAHLLTGPLEPTNEPYAIAKITGIKMCESYNRQYGTHYISVMPTNLYGPNDNFDLDNSHVLPALMRKFHEAKISGKMGELNIDHAAEAFHHSQGIEPARGVVVVKLSEVPPIDLELLCRF